MLHGTEILRALYRESRDRRIFLLCLYFFAALLLIAPAASAQTCTITPASRA